MVAANGASLFEPNALNITGLLSEFFAASLLVWESLHLHRAHKKLEECAEYEKHLNEMKANRDVTKTNENWELLVNLGKNRTENLEVRKLAEGYQSTKFRLALAGFVILAIASLFQLSANIVAQQALTHG